MPSDLEKELGLSRSTLAYQLNTLLGEGRIEKLGGGKYTRYRALRTAPTSQPASTPQPTETPPGQDPVSQEPPASPHPLFTRLHDLLWSLEKGLAQEEPGTAPPGIRKKSWEGWIVVLALALGAFYAWRWVGNRQGQPETRAAAKPRPISQAQALAPVPAQRNAPRAVSAKEAQTPPLNTSNPVVHNAPVSMDAAYAHSFADALYNMKYQDPYADADAVAAMLGGPHGQEIADTYYSKERIKKIQDEKQTWAFESEPVPLLTLTKDGEEDFQVKGALVITWEGQDLIDRRDLTLLVTIGHDAQGRPEVRDIIEVSSEEKK